MPGSGYRRSCTQDRVRARVHNKYGHPNVAGSSVLVPGSAYRRSCTRNRLGLGYTTSFSKACPNVAGAPHWCRAAGTGARARGSRAAGARWRTRRTRAQRLCSPPCAQPGPGRGACPARCTAVWCWAAESAAPACNTALKHGWIDSAQICVATSRFLHQDCTQACKQASPHPR